MKTIIRVLVAAPVLLALALAGCSLEAPSDPTGNVNPTGPGDVSNHYVSIGNSLTAGYMDTGLRIEGQQTSFPRLIANQIGLDAAGFSQPYIAPPGIGTTDVGAGNVASSVHFDGSTIKLMDIIPLADVPAMLLAAAQPTQYHNLGVPGAWATDVLNAYDKASSFGGENSFFDFINRASLYGNEEAMASYPTGPGTTRDVTYQTASLFQQTIAQGPRLLTLWVGGNDIYLGATSGNPNGAGGLPMTPVTEFQQHLTDMVALLAGGLAGRLGWDPATQTGLQPTIVLANLPDVEDVAHFIPVALFEQFIAATGAPVPGYDEGTVTYVLLPAVAWVPDNLGQDLPGTLTLTPAEVGEVQGHVTGYNQVIAGVVANLSATGLAKFGLADMNAYIKGLAPANKTWFIFLLPPHAPPWNAAEIEAAAATTFFSLDGFHPNNKGAAAMANEFIKEINRLDGSSIPEVDEDSVVWDPTYGVTATKAATPGVLMTPEAGRALAGMLK